MAASICIEAVAALAGLEVDRLALRRGGRVVFRDLSFRVDAGEAVAVVGPNGAGKTSLLRALAGFLEPYAGAIRFAVGGDKAHEDRFERGTFAGWLGHHDAIKSQLSPRQHLHFFGRYFGKAADADSTLARTGLARLADLPAQYLSAGQKKRLALARLIAMNRSLWLLDEPFAALDVEGKELVRSLISAHCAAGGIAIAATHESLDIPCIRLALEIPR
jgi:heme exporter protein A